MNPLEFYSLEELRKRSSEKWTNYDKDVLPLWVAEMDTKIPDEVKNKIQHLLEIGDTGYLSKKGFENYSSSFQGFAKRHWGWEFDPEKCVDTADVVQGCKKVIDAFLEHNKENSVIVSTPIYPPFMNTYAKGYQYFDAPLDKNYRLDFDKLEEAFKECTKNNKKAVYALCNPSNPSGTVFTYQELFNLCELSTKYKVLIVSDEIHGALVTQRNFENRQHTKKDCENPDNHGKHSSFIPLLSVENSKLAITVTSASKAFSLPGMKAALIIPSKDKGIQDLILNSGNFYQGSSEQFGAIAQTTCFNECDDYLYHLVQGIRNNIASFQTLAKTYFPNATFKVPEGTYFAFVNFEEYVRSGQIPKTHLPSKWFLDKAKVAFNPGRTFGVPETIEKLNQPNKYDTFVRINLATSQEILRMACEKVGESLI